MTLSSETFLKTGWATNIFIIPLHKEGHLLTLFQSLDFSKLCIGDKVETWIQGLQILCELNNGPEETHTSQHKQCQLLFTRPTINVCSGEKKIVQTRREIV